jgi:hypothetical protein
MDPFKWDMSLFNTVITVLEIKVVSITKHVDSTRHASCKHLEEPSPRHVLQIFTSASLKEQMTESFLAPLSWVMIEAVHSVHTKPSADGMLLSGASFSRAHSSAPQNTHMWKVVGEPLLP